MKIKLGEMLVGNGIISHDQLKEGLDAQARDGGLIGMILVSMNYITADQLVEYLKAMGKQISSEIP